MKPALWTITKEFAFEAAHQLPNHEGKCRRLHGHSYRAEVIVTSDALLHHGPGEGMVLDYDVISEAVEPLREKFLDHHFLNETLPVLPTAENIARWIYEMLKPTFGSFLHAVRVRETEKTSALYMEAPVS